MNNGGFFYLTKINISIIKSLEWIEDHHLIDRYRYSSSSPFYKAAVAVIVVDELKGNCD